jgi:hypothetical protein
MEATDYSDVSSDRNREKILSWSERRRQRYDSLFSDVLNVEIEQFAQYPGVCDLCHTPFYGILDESKLTLPLEGFIPKLLGNIGVVTLREDGKRYLTSVEHSNFYEIRQDIVRSGMFSRSQLSRCALFSQHELEVNDNSFLSLRPRRCECDFGSEPELTEEELRIIAMCEHDENQGFITQVESDFISGKPIRTGFRRRSTAAIRRRREKRKFKSFRIVVPKVPLSALGHPLGVVNSTPITLRFGYRPHGPRNCRRGEPRLRNRGLTSPPLRRSTPPEVGKKKYWYFFRKRGFYRLSRHHPLPGDPAC